MPLLATRDYENELFLWPDSPESGAGLAESPAINRLPATTRRLCLRNGAL